MEKCPVWEPRDAGSWPFGHRMLARIRDLDTLSHLFESESPASGKVFLAASIREHLMAASKAIDMGSHWLKSLIEKPSAIDAVLINFNAASCELLRLAPLESLNAWLPSLIALVQQHLAKDDPRRVEIERISAQAGRCTEAERESVVTSVRGAFDQMEQEHLRVRSFNGLVWGITALLSVLAIVVGVFFGIRSDILPLFDHPSRAAYAVVELVGLASASLAAAFSLRNASGTATPYALPTALAVIKLPSGALTAVLGLILLRSGVVAPLVVSGTLAVLGWAVVFGYAQQVFTGVLDRHGQMVLDSVRGPLQPRGAKA